MPVKIEQHTGLDWRHTKRVQAVTEKAMKTENSFERGRPASVVLKGTHREKYSVRWEKQKGIRVNRGNSGWLD
jgi:hypothetical protein